MMPRYIASRKTVPKAMHFAVSDESLEIFPTAVIFGVIGVERSTFRKITGFDTADGSGPKLDDSDLNSGSIFEHLDIKGRLHNT